MRTQQKDIIQRAGDGRRSFIAKGIGALTSLIAGTLAASVGTYLGSTPKTGEDTWADAGDISELRSGVPQELVFQRTRTDGWKVRNEKATAWVVVDEQNHLTAFSPLCTHLGCAYHWEARTRTFLCPCHGSEFEENGQVFHGPAGRALDRYLVKIEGDRLWLGPVQASGKS